MTEYQRKTVTSPEEAFDRLAEEFFVEERTDAEITLIVEGATPPDDPVFEIIQEMDLVDQYSAHGKGIRHQEDLPEELRDEEQHEYEQERVTPAEKDWSDSEVVTTLNALEVIKDNESDHDHINTLKHAQERLQELYGDDLKPSTSDTEDITEGDVETAFTLLYEEGVEYRGKDEHDHPNNVLYYALDFVDNEARFEGGIIPDHRDH